MSNWTAKCSSRNWAALRRRKLSQNYITQAYKYHALKMAKTATHTLPWGLTNTHTHQHIFTTIALQALYTFNHICTGADSRFEMGKAFS